MSEKNAGERVGTRRIETTSERKIIRKRKENNEYYNKPPLKWVDLSHESDTKG